MELAFKQLKVWNEAVNFAGDILDLTERIQTANKNFRLTNQIESAAASVSANIAEGKGRNSKKEFAQFLYIARGSLYETISFLYIFQQRQWISEDELKDYELKALSIAKMLKALINSILLNK